MKGPNIFFGLDDFPIYRSLNKISSTVIPLYLFYRNCDQTPERRLLEICHQPDARWGFCSWNLVFYHCNILNIGRLVLVLFHRKVPHNSADRQNKHLSLKFRSMFKVQPQTSDIRVTYEYIRVTYGWYTSTWEWLTDQKRAHTSDIRMTYEWYASSYEWHTNDIQMTYKQHVINCIQHLKILNGSFQYHLW